MSTNEGARRGAGLGDLFGTRKQPHDRRPCSRMETEPGPGGYNVMRGHGEITAVVIESGAVCAGDTVQPLDATFS
jgi:hypothetical protein